MQVTDALGKWVTGLDARKIKVSGPDAKEEIQGVTYDIREVACLCISTLDPQKKKENLSALRGLASTSLEKEHGQNKMNALGECIGRPTSLTDVGLADVKAALDACMLSAMDSTTANDLYDYCGRLQGEVVARATTATAWSEERGGLGHYFKDVLHVIACTRSFPEVSSLGADHTERVIKVATACIQFKAAVVKIGTLQEGASEEEKRELGIDVLNRKSQLTNIMAEKVDPADALHCLGACQVGQQVLGQHHEYITEFAKASRKVALSHLAQCKQRLEKVAGGLSDGSSWKCSLSGGETIDSKPMQKAMEALSNVYQSAINRRTAELYEAFGGTALKHPSLALRC